MRKVMSFIKEKLEKFSLWRHTLMISSSRIEQFVGASCQFGSLLGTFYLAYFGLLALFGVEITFGLVMFVIIWTIMCSMIYGVAWIMWEERRTYSVRSTLHAVS